MRCCAANSAVGQIHFPVHARSVNEASSSAGTADPALPCLLLAALEQSLAKPFAPPAGNTESKTACNAWCITPPPPAFPHAQCLVHHSTAARPPRHTLLPFPPQKPTSSGGLSSKGILSPRWTDAELQAFYFAVHEHKSDSAAVDYAAVVEAVGERTAEDCEALHKQYQTLFNMPPSDQMQQVRHPGT